MSPHEEKRFIDIIVPNNCTYKIGSAKMHQIENDIRLSILTLWSKSTSKDSLSVVYYSFQHELR